MKLKLAMISLLLLVGSGSMRAQCSGYSSNAPTKAVLTPSQVATQGGTTATITVRANWSDGTPMDGALFSHQVTVTPGTWVGTYWSSSNGATALRYYTADGSTAHQGEGAYNLNGSAPDMWKMDYPNIGHYYDVFYVVTDAQGNTTQDRVRITTVSGAVDTLVSQDSMPTNFYAYMGSSFQGPSMLNACTLCQNQPYKCINKMHHPRQHWQVTNKTTNEYHDAGWVYGNVACETCVVNYSGSSPYISFNPGDAISFNVENQVNCDEFGLIYDNNGGDTFNIQTEYAFTTSVTLGSMCQLIPEPNGGHAIECPLRYICKKGSAPPDFDPAYIASDRNCATPGFCVESDIPVFPPNWLLGGAGVRFTINGGGVWQFPFYDAEGFVVGVRKKSDFINLLFNIADAALPSPFGANAISCTNYDLGTSPFSVWP